MYCTCTYITVQYMCGTCYLSTAFAVFPFQLHVTLASLCFQPLVRFRYVLSVLIFFCQTIKYMRSYLETLWNGGFFSFFFHQRKKGWKVERYHMQMDGFGHGSLLSSYKYNALDQAKKGRVLCQVYLYHKKLERIIGTSRVRIAV